MKYSFLTNSVKSWIFCQLIIHFLILPVFVKFYSNYSPSLPLDNIWVMVIVWRLRVNITVFALSGIASQNATQIDPPCDSKCHMRCTHVRYKRKHRLFDKNTQCQGGWQWIKNAVIIRHSSSYCDAIEYINPYFQFLTRLILNTLDTYVVLLLVICAKMQLSTR